MLSAYKQCYTYNNQSLELSKYMNSALVMWNRHNSRGYITPPHTSQKLSTPLYLTPFTRQFIQGLVPRPNTRVRKFFVCE